MGFDGNGYADTFTILTSTIREDSVRTDNLSNNLVGVINDPFFGKYQAQSFFQLNLPQLSNVINTEKLDSVVLIMQFTSPTAYYGDLNSEMSFNVYELSSSMDSTNSTYSNQSVPYNPTAIGTFTGKYKPADSSYIRELGSKVRIAPSISVKLSAAFANKIFNANSTDLASQAAFLNLIKGIAIVPSANPVSGTGSIAAFNMLGSFSKIRIYYNDSLQSDFKVLTDDSRRFSQYSFSGQNAEIIKQKTASKKSSFDTTFIQSLTGCKTRILIPHLFNIAKTKSISIAKAEIIIRPLDASYTSAAPLPTRLLLLQPDATTGVNTSLVDLAEPFYDGYYKSVINYYRNEYRFNITRHVQNLFIEYQRKGANNNRGFFLIIPTDNPIAPSRLMLDTRKKIPNAGIEFRLYYSEL